MQMLRPFGDGWIARARAAARQSRSLVGRFAPAAAVAFLGCAISVAGFQVVERRQHAGATRAFERQVGNQAAALQRELAINVEAVASVAGLFATSATVERDGFSKFVERILPRNPGLWGISWLVRVAAVERESFERSERAGGLTITRRTHDSGNAHAL